MEEAPALRGVETRQHLRVMRRLLLSRWALAVLVVDGTAAVSSQSLNDAAIVIFDGGFAAGTTTSAAVLTKSTSIYTISWTSIKLIAVNSITVSNENDDVVASWTSGQQTPSSGSEGLLDRTAGSAFGMHAHVSSSYVADGSVDLYLTTEATSSSMEITTGFYHLTLNWNGSGSSTTRRFAVCDSYTGPSSCQDLTNMPQYMNESSYAPETGPVSGDPLGTSTTSTSSQSALVTSTMSYTTTTPANGLPSMSSSPTTSSPATSSTSASTTATSSASTSSGALPSTSSSSTMPAASSAATAVVSTPPGLSTGAITGIVLGVAAVFLIVAVILAFVCVRRRRRRPAAAKEPPYGFEMMHGNEKVGTQKPKAVEGNDVVARMPSHDPNAMYEPSRPSSAMGGGATAVAAGTAIAAKGTASAHPNQQSSRSPMESTPRVSGPARSRPVTMEGIRNDRDRSRTPRTSNVGQDRPYSPYTDRRPLMPEIAPGMPTSPHQQQQPESRANLRITPDVGGPSVDGPSMQRSPAPRSRSQPSRASDHGSHGAYAHLVEEGMTEEEIRRMEEEERQLDVAIQHAGHGQ